MKFKNDVAVVTGGARGIGYAVAQKLGDEGANIAVFDLERNSVDQAVAKLRDRGINAVGITGDVRDRAAVYEGAQTVIDALGGIDILVNNAGTHITDDPEDLSEDHWNREIQTTLNGSFFWSQAAAKLSMIPHRAGRIVNIGSGASLAVIPSSASYVTAKHGLIGLTKALAVDWAQYGIRVNCVCPGFTWTELSEAMAKEHPTRMENRVAQIPFGDGALPEDVAKAVAFFASKEDSGAVTGTVMSVDGGSAALLSGYKAPGGTNPKAD